jgi:multidrug efflux pump subunit AcrA (membrane-fusion protein)
MKQIMRILFVIGPILGIIAGVYIDRAYLQTTHDQQHNETALEHAKKHLDPTYVCPMHSEIVSKEKGTCPICGMDLVTAKPVDTSEHVSSPFPVVEISPAVINSLGVRTVKLERKSIARRIETPGFVQQIKKGQMSYYSAPFTGVVTRTLFERNHWYDYSGEPLLELQSEELLTAQKEHLQIFAATSPAEQHARAVKPEPAAEKNKTEVNANGLVDIMTLPDDDEDELAMFLDEEGNIKQDYRMQLETMGLDNAAIADMEKEMLAVRNKILASHPAEKSPVADRPEPASNIAPETAPVIAATEGKPLTLEQSRDRLRGLGMRDEDITQLEIDGTPTDKLVMYSNQPGRVLDTTISEGQAVESGELLFKLGGEVRAVVLANAFQRDANWISTGQQVEVRMPHESGVVWPGIVNQGAVSINPDSQNIGIKLTFTAPLDKVRSNMYVVGTVFGNVRENVIAVPAQSIIRTEGEDRVIKSLGNGRFVPVVVTVGVETGDETEILEGLEEGDEVVVMAQFLIDSESSLQASLQRLISH